MENVENEAVPEPPTNASGRSAVRRLLGWTRRHAVALAVTALVGASALVFLTNRWFVNPTLDAPTEADAIAVLAGGGRLRDNLGVHYLATGVADTIVFSNPGGERRRFGVNQYCNSEQAFRLPRGEQICFDPDPGTTRGEIREIARLAEERGWDHIVLVTSVDQATRARRLMERCFEGTIEVVAVPHDQSILFRAPYEWGASLKATLLRSC